MRTTLTIEDELLEALRERAHLEGTSFKQAVNDVIRRGLMTGESEEEDPKAFRVRAKACGFRPGIDPLRLNQLNDKLELQTSTEVPEE